MRRKLCWLIPVVAMVAIGAEASTSDHCRVRNTTDVVELCSTPQ